jgi:hypothetical protein
MNSIPGFLDSRGFRPVVSHPPFPLRAARITCPQGRVLVLNEAIGVTCFFKAPHGTFYFASEETAGGNR